MPDRVGTSFSDPNSGFTGQCDESNGACTGTFSDEGKFINIQTVMRFLETVTDPGSAGRILDSLDDSLGYARVGSFAIQAVGGASVADTSINQAQLAIDTARQQLPFDVSDWGPFLVDAGAKTVVALNQLGAGSITLQFAQARLARDLEVAPLNILNWLISGAIVIVSLIVLYRYR